MDRLWEQVQGALMQSLGAQNFEIWIRPIRLSNLTPHAVHLQVPNRYYRDWVQANYGPTMTDAFGRALGHGVELHFEIASEQAPVLAEADRPPQGSGLASQVDEGEFLEGPPLPPVLDEGRPPTEEVARSHASSTIGVSPDKVFDNFVVGASNQFAHAAALAVADQPGESQYNPLYIYGGTGLGKTHLLHAIGNEVRRRDPSARILYVTAEQFTNELIDALRYRRMSNFREKYRRWPAVLLMDDVQFLTGKDRTQEELFHTFEWLKERGRQIVFTSDVLPREVHGFEPRLRTRCESGMLADMQPPDLETLVAILHQKAADLGLDVTPDVARFLAARVRGNVREIEGLIKRLSALCKLHQAQPTIAFARLHLGNVLADEPHSVDAQEVIKAVASLFNVRVEDLMGSRRQRQLVRPRHLSMWLVREHTDLSFPDIGRVFGKDHATIHHACKKVAGDLPNDADLRGAVAAIRRSLGLA